MHDVALELRLHAAANRGASIRVTRIRPARRRAGRKEFDWLGVFGTSGEVPAGAIIMHPEFRRFLDDPAFCRVIERSLLLAEEGWHGCYAM